MDTPYTVMTFGANHLYGEFGQVETEGQLGSFIGNSTSVNLGNGETLDVLYNEASGTIQVELVATPSKATYDWDIGSGTWNASSAGDWNPPGNGTMPELQFQRDDWHGQRRNRDVGPRPDDQQSDDHNPVTRFPAPPIRSRPTGMSRSPRGPRCRFTA